MLIPWIHSPVETPPTFQVPKLALNADGTKLLTSSSGTKLVPTCTPVCPWDPRPFDEGGDCPNIDDECDPTLDYPDNIIVAIGGMYWKSDKADALGDCCREGQTGSEITDPHFCIMCGSHTLSNGGGGGGAYSLCATGSATTTGYVNTECGGGTSFTNTTNRFWVRASVTCAIPDGESVFVWIVTGMSAGGGDFCGGNNSAKPGPFLGDPTTHTVSSGGISGWRMGDLIPNWYPANDPELNFNFCDGRWTDGLAVVVPA